MAKPTSGEVSVARSESRPRTSLLLESIALRHQIAVLELSGTRRPCFRLWDRLFWILFSRWWPQWRDSLIIVQPETVLRWRREGWSALRRYRLRGRWRGGRPRVSREVRHLIVRMTRENFRWGAPRIHGELLMLGFSVSEATVSRYLPARSRQPGQSWRTFLRNQAMAFGHSEYFEERSRGDASPYIDFCWDPLKRLTAAQIATIGAVLRRDLGQTQLALNNRRVGLRSAKCDCAVSHRAASVSGGTRRAVYDRSGAAFPIRSPPWQLGRALRVFRVSARADEVLRSHSVELRLRVALRSAVALPGAAAGGSTSAIAQISNVIWVRHLPSLFSTTN